MPKKYKEHVCPGCDKLTTNARFHDNSCQQRYQSKVYISKWLNDEISGTKSGGASKYIKEWLRQKYGDKCQDCGWNKIHPKTLKVPLEVEHVDGNWENNRPENLKLICPNCHSLTETYRGLNAGRAKPRPHRPRKLPE